MLRRCLLPILILLAFIASFALPAPPVATAQGNHVILANWGHVRITVLYSDTGCFRNAPLYLASPEWRLLFASAPESVGQHVDIGYYGPGTELIFYYRPGVPCTENASYSTSGRWLITHGADVWTLGVEDWHDWDFDDIIFRVEQYTHVPPMNPEPTYTAGTQNTVSWINMGSGTYEVQRATDAGFTTDLVTASTSATSYTFTGLTDDQIYYYRHC